MAKSVIQSKKTRVMTFRRRMASVKKKAMELTTLCGIEACVICFGPDGQLHTWPENLATVDSTVNKYRRNFTDSIPSQSKNKDEIAELRQKIEDVERAIEETKRENSARVLRILMDMGRDEAAASAQ